MDQMGWIKECAALGLDGVELLSNHFPRTDHDYLVALKKLCADQYLTIAMVSAGGHLTTLDDAERAESVASIKTWVDVAVFMGAPCVRFFCGSGSELEAGGKPLFEKVVVALRQVADVGAAKGVVMAMENHGGTTAAQLLALIKAVNHPFLRFTLDTGNFPPTSQVGPDTYKSIRKCAPMAAIVHAKFFNVLPDGRDADFNWARIRNLLAKAGFRGFLSVEYEGADPDESAVMRRIAGYLRKLRK